MENIEQEVETIQDQGDSLEVIHVEDEPEAPKGEKAEAGSMIALAAVLLTTTVLCVGAVALAFQKKHSN